MKTNFDINKTPLITTWETTQACDVACLDYRNWIRPEPDPLELSTLEAENLIDRLVELNPPIFVLSGADPLKRSDIFQLLRYASARGLHPFLALNATPLLTPKAISDLKHAGVSRLILNLNGFTEELHDLVCGVHGSFVRTMEALQWADQWRLPCQIATHYCERNLHDLENLAALLKTFHIVSWTITFPVPTSLGEIEETPSPAQFEEAFARIYALSQTLPFKVKTSEAPHYRRFVLQQQAKARATGAVNPALVAEGIPGILPIHESRGSMIISHTGEVYPCALLPVSGGNVRVQDLVEIYRSSQAFTLLRDSSNLTGKCGECEFKQVCGGSRAQAYAMNADMFREDPACIYHPLAPVAVRVKSLQTLPEEGATVQEP